MRHWRNGSERLSPPTVFLFLYIYGNNGQQFVFFSSHLRFIVKLGKIGHVWMFHLSTHFSGVFLWESLRNISLLDYLRDSFGDGNGLASCFSPPVFIITCEWGKIAVWHAIMVHDVSCYIDFEHTDKKRTYELATKVVITWTNKYISIWHDLKQCA